MTLACGGRIVQHFARKEAGGVLPTGLWCEAIEASRVVVRRKESIPTGNGATRSGGLPCIDPSTSG